MDATATEPAPPVAQSDRPFQLTVAEFWAYVRAAFEVTELDLQEKP